LILGKPILIKEAETLLLYSMKISVTGIMIWWHLSLHLKRKSWTSILLLRYGTQFRTWCWLTDRCIISHLGKLIQHIIITPVASFHIGEWRLFSDIFYMLNLSYSRTDILFPIPQ
jgi:hypothetical protein